ncbi:hypothetical protein Tco_0803400 [Tanacetum coccineum]|uniref:Uncharacterized protein n=1 Tax=Tanacetum coccineum TaxID=301880 RepID=A0ABQ5A5J7_9ASTR
MGDKNHIRTLGAYFRPSYEGYRNTIELPDGNNVVPLRSDTIRLVQNGYSFHGTLGQGAPVIPSYTWEDLLLVSGSFFPRKGYAKLQYDYYVPTHQGDLFLKHGLVSRTYLISPLNASILLIPKYYIFYDHVSFHLKCEIERAAEESWEIIENLALYDYEGWNDSRDFVKPVKAISLPPNISKTPDRRLLELEDQIKFLVKGPQTRIPQAYVKEVSSYPHPTEP